MLQIPVVMLSGVSCCHSYLNNYRDTGKTAKSKDIQPQTSQSRRPGRDSLDHELSRRRAHRYVRGMRKKPNPKSIGDRAAEPIIISDSRLIARLLDLQARIEARLQHDEPGNS
jgi:hypothetical protein